MPVSLPLRWPRSLRGQLACCFALVGGLLAVSMAVALGSLLAQNGRREAGSELLSVADNAAHLLADGLHLRLREVQVLAESPTLWAEGLDAQRVSQVLYRSQALNPHSVWIGVADPAGLVRTATRDMLLGAQVGGRPWFQAGRAGPHVGDVHPAKLLAGLLPPAADGGPPRFVDFAAPIIQGGRLLGVLGMHGSWDWTRATIESLLPPPQRRDGLEVFVFDRAGQMIYAPDGTLEQHRQAGQTLLRPMPDGHRDHGEAGVVTWRDGQDYFTAAVRLRALEQVSDLGWTVVTRQPVALALATAREGVRMALLVGLLGAGLAAALGWWLAGRLARPLRRIAGDAQAVQLAMQNGQPPHALPLRHGSLEVQQLSQALLGMSERLLQANAELEQRVQSRTQALEQANQALARLAHHDPLTGLLNRRGFDERVAQALASARRRQAPLSLLVIDADHFKQVNDRHGHAAGDQVLQAIAQLLGTRLREADIVGRIGGEEFAVALPDTGSLGASIVAAALVTAVRVAPMPVVGSISISCGGAAMLVGDETVDAALARADAALYQAKQQGRNRHCVAADLPATPAGTLCAMAAALPRPLAPNDSRFDVPPDEQAKDQATDQAKLYGPPRSSALR
jgi:diguanylate cyclase (GGDEF)-like protein